MRLTILLLLGSTLLLAEHDASNWGGEFEPCERRSELLKHDHMDLGVRFSTSNPDLAKQFRRAMNFWATVVDLSWYEDDSSSCSLQLVDGHTTLFRNGTVARSQFTEWDNFQGWIAFDPTAPLTRTEMFLTSVHEIGHILGLKHNPSPKSIMYFLDLEGPEMLETEDLVSLASHHKLRLRSWDKPIRPSA